LRKKVLDEEGLNNERMEKWNDGLSKINPPFHYSKLFLRL